jgi:hypothetical protein
MRREIWKIRKEKRKSSRRSKKKRRGSWMNTTSGKR